MASTQEILNKLGHDLIADMVDQIARKDKVATKELINSFSFTTDENTLQISSSAKQSIFINRGRNAGGRPPIKKIMEWMKAKNIRGRSYRGRFRRLRDAAFFISLKIESVGYKGINYVENSLMKFRPYIEENLGLSYAEELEEILINLEKKNR